MNDVKFRIAKLLNYLEFFLNFRHHLMVDLQNYLECCKNKEPNVDRIKNLSNK